MRSDLKICQTKLDKNGGFKFGKIAIGKYLIRTSFLKKDFEVSITPEFQIVDLTKYENYLLDKPFQVETLKSDNIETSFYSFFVGSFVVSCVYLCYDYVSVHVNRINLDLANLNNNNMIDNV